MSLQSVRGMRDILPDEQAFWQFLISNFETVATSLGFKRIDLPVVENVDLFSRGLGEMTDVVEKEMFVLESRSEEDGKTALRPEFTAGTVRAYIQNGMRSKPQPVMLFSIGPVYRYGRPQKNRYREFYQLNLEILGDANSKYDLLTIVAVWCFLEMSKINNAIINLNSIGCKNCRPGYRQKLIDYFKTNYEQLCEDCKRRLETNPLRVLDCKEAGCQTLAKNAPKTIDNLCPECQESFNGVKAGLDKFKINYEVTPELVRGLDYYNRTVFEINIKDDVSRQGSLGGGGRYDYLFEILGETSTPGVGAAIGLDRCVNLLVDSKIDVPTAGQPTVLIAGFQSTEEDCQKIYQSFISAGVIPFFLPTSDGLQKQLEFANKINAKFVLIVGDEEVKNSKYQLKSLESGNQETLTLEETIKKVTLLGSS